MMCDVMKKGNEGRVWSNVAVFILSILTTKTICTWYALQSDFVSEYKHPFLKVKENTQKGFFFEINSFVCISLSLAKKTSCRLW